MLYIYLLTLAHHKHGDIHHLDKTEASIDDPRSALRPLSVLYWQRRQ